MKHHHHISMFASQAAAILTMFAVLLILLGAAMAATGEMGLALRSALPGLVIAAIAFRANRGTRPS